MLAEDHSLCINSKLWSLGTRQVSLTEGKSYHKILEIFNQQLIEAMQSCINIDHYL